MCYYPYFRGKQYELITIRENAKLLKESGITPIIEPVKKSFNGLKSALEAIRKAGGNAIVIINPQYGELSKLSKFEFDFINSDFLNNKNISIGLLLTEEHSLSYVKKLYKSLTERSVTLIHAGFTDAKSLSELQGVKDDKNIHIFKEANCGKLYQRHFNVSRKVLIRDGFEKQINRRYPDFEFFSDLHITFELENMNGFSDFLIVGDEYLETGGPAYAVAIHITYIDKDNDDVMYIRHFVSDRKDDPKDPAGKFAEALDKLIMEINKSDTKILQTEAIKEFIDLYNRKHFPGLGYVKKLSMQHHIETLADFIKNKNGS
jgi:hypothetical protein